MLTAEILAPEIPAVSALLAAAVLFIAWMIASGALTIWRRSIGKLLVWMADTIDDVSFDLPHITTIKPLAPLAAVFRSLESTVDHYLGEAVRWSEKGAVTLFKFFTAINVWMAKEIASLATDTWHAIAGIHTYTKAQIQAWVRNVYGVTIHKLTVAVGNLTHVTIPRVLHRIDTLTRRLAHEAKVRANAIAHTLPRIGRLEKTAKAQAGRLSRVEKTLAAAGAAALVWAALRRLGLGWLRCGNVTKAGKAVCGMNPALLETILLDAALLAVTVNIEEFAEELQTVTAEAASLIHHLAA